MRHQFVRSSAGLRDPNFKNVTLLLHGDGTNGGQNNTFLDSSGSNNAITRTGNVAQGSFSPYGDRWSNYFDGTGDSLTLASNAAFAIGTGQFTMEFWIQFRALSNIQEFIRTALSDQNGPFVFYYTTSTNQLNIGPYAGVGGGGITVSWTPNLRQWYHIAASRDSSNTQRLFIDGILVGSSTSTANYTQSGFGIFQRFANFNGYFSNFRFINGRAIYTSNFAVPTEPLTAVANTVLLTCQSNRFRDASSNNFTITRNGDVSVQRFSPFSPDTLYRTDRIGGSAYFDGSSDWLFVANRALKLTAGFFTAECWVYLDSFPGNDFFGYTIFSDYYWTGGNTGGYFVNIGSNQKVNLYASSGVYAQQAVAILSSNNSIVLKQWNHIAIVRGSGNLINIYINGVSTTTPVARTSLSLLSGGAANLESRIGVRLHDVWYGPPGDAYGPFIGTISDLRVINGKCLYTANFTPPTEPLTAIPETTFLGRFANASIVDNAMMNNLETVGNAQINTNAKKFGTGALDFDGNGDYLNFRVVNGLALNADFTVELWFYARASRTHRMFSLHASGTGASFFAGVRIDLNGNGTFGLYSSNGVTHNMTTSQGSWSVNTWTHLAITKSGNDFRFFKDGTQFYTVAPGHVLMNGTVHTIGMLAGYGADYFDGLIDDFRVTKGVARYTSNFTPPTAPFPDF